MLAWVINITTYLSNPALDADIVGADRFGLALVLAGWIAGDALIGAVCPGVPVPQARPVARDKAVRTQLLKIR